MKAVIVTLPSATAATLPVASTVAFASSEDFQEMESVALAGVKAAAKKPVSPTLSVNVFGVTATAVAATSAFST